MLKRLTTILLLLTLGALPAAAQMYRLSERIYEAIEQSGDDREMMSCCTKSSGCTMEMSEAQTALCQSQTNCSIQCVCTESEAKASVTIMVLAPQLPSSDDLSIIEVALPSWSQNLQSQFPLSFSLLHKKENACLQTICLRI